MFTISANDLKRQGISAFHGEPEALVTVRGRPEYVVLNMKTYEHMREAELEIAVLESERDLATGHFTIESVEAHIKRLLNMGEDE